MPDIKQTGKLRLEFDVPRDIQSFSPYHKTVATSDIKNDYYVAQSDPAWGENTLKVSSNVYQDPATKAWGLRPFYTRDTNDPGWRSSRWLTLNDLTLKADQFEQNHEGTQMVKDVKGIDLTRSGIPFITSIFKSAQVGVDPSVVANAIKIAAAEAVPKTLTSSAFVWTAQSKDVFPENVGWHLFFKNFGSDVTALDDYFAFKFGQYCIKLSSRGTARLYKFKQAVDGTYQPVEIDRWEFAKAKELIGKNAYLTIVPIAGSISFYFTSPKYNNRIPYGYYVKEVEDGHLSRVFSRSVPQQNDVITVDPGYLLIAQNAQMRHSYAISAITYFDSENASSAEGTFVSPVEEMPDAPPPTSAPYSLTKENGLVADYIPGKALNKTNITYALKDGSVPVIESANGTPSLPDWVSNGARKKPRVFATLKTNSIYKTPYLFWYGIQFPASYVPDSRQGFTAPCGHSFSLYQCEDQDMDTFEVTYLLERTDLGTFVLDDKGAPLLDSDGNPLPTVDARLWQLCDRCATTVRVWWDEYTDQTMTRLKESKLLFDGVSDDEGISWEWKSSNVRKLTFKFVSQWYHFRKKHLLQPGLYAGKPCVEAIKLLIEAAGFSTQKHFEVKTYNAIDLSAIKLPEANTQGQKRFSARANMPTHEMVKYILTFLSSQDVAAWLRWKHTGYDSITGAPVMKWVLEIKPGSQSEGFPQVPARNAVARIASSELSQLQSDPNLLWYAGYQKKRIPPQGNEVVFTTYINYPTGTMKITSLHRNYDSLFNPSSPDYVGTVLRFPYDDTNLGDLGDIFKTRASNELRGAYLLSQVGFHRDEINADLQWKYTLNLMDKVSFYDRDNLTIECAGYIKEIRLSSETMKQLRASCLLDSRFEWSRGKLSKRALSHFTRQTLGAAAMPTDFNSTNTLINGTDDPQEVPEMPSPPASSGILPIQFPPTDGGTTPINAFVPGYSQIGSTQRLALLSEEEQAKITSHTPLSADLLFNS